MFSVGQKVMCINDDFSNLKDKEGIKFPKSGLTYTVRKLVNIGGPGILLKEIINDEYCFVLNGNAISEPSFSERRFISLQSDFVKIEFSQALEAVESSAN